MMYSLKRRRWWSRRYEWTVVVGHSFYAGSAPSKSVAEADMSWAIQQLVAA